ncbi:MAG: hypothetical protein IPN62_10815 [Flavobacteriales bacterium]|nr:hypothetical protein [Flavobacteriales bacterium]
MTIDIIHDDPDVTIDVHPAQRLVRLTWKRSVAGPEYRALLLRLLDVVKDLDLKLWLSDGRKAGPILYTDQVWTMQEYTPLVLAAGLERIAIVNSKDGLNLLAVDRMVNATPPDAPYEIAFFEDPAIAQLWLMDPSRSKPAVEVPRDPGVAEA